MEHKGCILSKHTSRAKRINRLKPRWTRQGKLLYWFLIPLFISVAKTLMSGEYAQFIREGIGFVLLLGAAASTAKGVAQETAYELATITKAPKTPYKTIAMLLLSVAVFYLGFVAGGKPFLTSLFVGLLSAAGYWMYYGLDPRKNKLPAMEDINPEFVLDTLNEARSKLLAAEADTVNIGDRKLRKKLDDAIGNAHIIIETIEQDPKDIRSARKFLMVFLDGIADVAHKYIEVDEKDIDSPMKDKLYGLIDDVELRFEQELARLKANNLIDLDITVDALNIQIKH
jgi:5-bromo-4-chloroindolyl phosphate hydrolysis protein